MFGKLLPTVVIFILGIGLHLVQATYWTELGFQKGDILICHMNMFADHVLLATNRSYVAHMVGDHPSGDGHLWEESWESYHLRQGGAETNCEVKGRAISANLAVDKAREDVATFNGQKIYYNLLTCNCEHWVAKWATGKAWSSQSIQYPTSSCDVNMNPITDADFAKYGAGAKSTHGHHCYSECVKTTGGKFDCDLGPQGGRGDCSPSRGTTYKGAACAGDCQPYLDYHYCYTDSSGNWDYCGPHL